MAEQMSSRHTRALTGSARDTRPNLGIVLRIPFQTVVDRVSVGLANAGFDDRAPGPSHAVTHGAHRGVIPEH